MYESCTICSYHKIIGHTSNIIKLLEMSQIKLIFSDIFISIFLYLILKSMNTFSFTVKQDLISIKYDFYSYTLFSALSAFPISSLCILISKIFVVNKMHQSKKYLPVINSLYKKCNL